VVRGEQFGPERGEDGGETGRAVWLVWLGALALAAGVLSLGIGLLVTS